MKSFIVKYGAYTAWGLALAAMLGSLYFSEVLKITPCVLCWYQRIAMYPLVVIIGAGILRKDTSMWAYALPLSIAGTGIALYQNLLVWNILSERLAPCVSGVSCVTQQFVALNFITIPLLSLAAFALITALMFVYRASHTHA
jgi:disulfide bond formation protein DsbB